MRIFRATLLFVFSFHIAGFAQGSGPFIFLSPGGGNADLYVRVRLPDDRPYLVPVQVQILSVDGIATSEGFTRDEGLAEFHDIHEGRHSIRLSGDGIETTTSNSFEIIVNERTHSEYVYVKLIVKDKENAGTQNGKPTVSSQELNVPKRAKNELEKGMDAFNKGDTKMAVANFEKAIEIYPQYAQAYNNLGVVRIAQGDKPGSKQAFTRAVKINDHFAPGYVNLARMALVDNMLADAAPLLEKALAIDPNNLEGLALQARVQFLGGLYEQALVTVNKVHSLPHVRFAEVHLVAAEVYQKQDRNADAITECQMYLKEFPDSPRAAQVRQAMSQIQARSH